MTLPFLEWAMLKHWLSEGLDSVWVHPLYTCEILVLFYQGTTKRNPVQWVLSSTTFDPKLNSLEKRSLIWLIMSHLWCWRGALILCVSKPSQAPSSKPRVENSMSIFFYICEASSHIFQQCIMYLTNKQSVLGSWSSYKKLWRKKIQSFSLFAIVSNEKQVSHYFWASMNLKPMVSSWHTCFLIETTLFVWKSNLKTSMKVIILYLLFAQSPPNQKIEGSLNQAIGCSIDQALFRSWLVKLSRPRASGLIPFCHQGAVNHIQWILMWRMVSCWPKVAWCHKHRLADV